MNPVQEEQKRRVQADFDRKADWWRELYENPRDFRAYNLLTRRRTILDLLPPAEGAILDIGCGSGDFVPAEIERGARVLGIEVSSEMARTCHGKYGAQVRDGKALFCRGDIEAIPLPDASVGGVLCVAVIEYLLRAEKALEEIARVLKPGGFAIITAPNRISPFMMLDRASHSIRRVGSRVYRALRGRPKDDGSYMHGIFTPWDLDRRVQAAGLVIDRRAFSTFGSYRYGNTIPFSITFSESLGGLRHSRLGVIGSNYIVRALRPASKKGPDRVRP